MANNGTKIYIGSGSSKGIRLRADIETVLGESSGDLGTLCKSNNINPWAKYKPFRSAAKSFTDSSAWSTAMTDAKYGFLSPSGCLTFALSQTPPSWETCYRTYGKPRGLSNNELSMFSISGFFAESCNFSNTESFGKDLERNFDFEYFSKSFIESTHFLPVPHRLSNSSINTSIFSNQFFKSPSWK